MMTLEQLRNNMRLLADLSNAAHNIVYGTNGMSYKYFLMTEKIAMQTDKSVEMLEEIVIKEYKNPED